MQISSISSMLKISATSSTSRCCRSQCNISRSVASPYKTVCMDTHTIFHFPQESKVYVSNWVCSIGARGLSFAQRGSLLVEKMLSIVLREQLTRPMICNSEKKRCKGRLQKKSSQTVMHTRANRMKLERKMHSLSHRAGRTEDKY